MEGDLAEIIVDTFVRRAFGLYAIVIVVGGLIALAVLSVRAYASRLFSEIERKLARLDHVEEQLSRLIAELPLHYQRRDEAIREYTAMNAKLDRLWDALVEMRGGRRG